MNDNELSIKQILSMAEQEEANNDNPSAVALYNKAIKADALNIYAYDRLMKIFRKLKDYKKELAIINSGIKAYEQFYKNEEKGRSKKVSEISQKLNKSFGLTDKRGNSLYNPEPIARWKIRKLTVEKKMKK